VKLEQSFEVAASLERVWEALIDVERVAPCLPGAAVSGRNDDGSYNGTFTIKIGPTTASYTGRLEMEEIDEGSHTATMRAQGSDRRGQGGAKATIVSRLLPAGEGSTRVEVDTDYSITGRLARFGRGGMIEDISERLLREFATRLQASLAGGAAPPAEATASPRETAVADEPAPVAPDGAGEGEEDTGPAAEGAAGAEGAAVAEAAVAGEGAAAGQAAAPAAPPTQTVERPPAPPVTPPPTGDEAPFPGATPPAGEDASIDALALVGGVIADRVRRNRAPLAAGLGLLLMVLMLRRRRRSR